MSYVEDPCIDFVKHKNGTTMETIGRVEGLGLCGLGCAL